MHLVFGELRPWDRYLTVVNSAVNNSFFQMNVARLRGYDLHYRDLRNTRMFLKNVAHVETFITNAAFDLNVYAAAIPPALARHTETLISSSHEPSLPMEEARPGQIVLRFRPNTFPDIPDLETRTIRFPAYLDSGHAVSLTQPGEFLTDSNRWLTQLGVLDEED